MEVSNLHMYDAAQGLWIPFTRAMLAGPELTPIGTIATITVGTSAATLAALMTAAGGASIAANCTWLRLTIKDDQNAGQVIKLNETHAVTADLYDAAMSRSGDLPDSLIGRANKALFDAYSLIASASAVVLVRQFTG